MSELHELAIDNKEGFVIRFTSGLRYKIKFQEYLRIHRIVTNVSTINIWEALKAGDDLKELLDRVPDEFYKWVKSKVAEYETNFAAIEQQCKRDFKVLENRKLTAAYFLKCKHPAVLFKMLDGKNYKEVIWKTLRPVYTKPYFAGDSEL